jgi:hypothetical protein
MPVSVFVWSIVSRVVRAQLVKSAGRIFCVQDRPAQLVGWAVVDRARARPADVGRCAVLCGVVRCCAVLCGRARPGACRILFCVATWPHAAAIGL